MIRSDVPQSPPLARPQLAFEQTVPRTLVHRRALGEVFVADSAQVGDDEFLLALQVPRAHSLWFDRLVPYHDPFAMAEACRQGAFVVVHRYLRVPHGLPFSLQRVEFRVPDLESYRDGGEAPLEAICDLRLADKHRQGEVLVAVAFEGELTIGGTLAMTMGGALVFLPSDDYEVLRAHQRARKRRNGPAEAPEARPIGPALVGRRDERNVVVAEPSSGADGEFRFPIVVDRSHPSFFDHPQDHLPGPLIVEAYRQAAIVAANRAGALSSPLAAVTAGAASFSDFAELDAPAECSAAVSAGDGPPVAVELGLHQLGNKIAEAHMELVECP